MSPKMLSAPVMLAACVSLSCGGSESGARSGSDEAHGAAPFFAAGQTWMGRPFYASRVAEQAEPAKYEAQAQALRFKLESHAIRFARIGTDDALPPRTEWAVPMGIVNGSLAVLTSRCEIDYRYPLSESEPDPRFRNLALFDAEGRVPRNVFMLEPLPERPDLSDVRDPRQKHWVFKDRLYLEGVVGDRYFDVLGVGAVPRVRAELVSGTWSSNDGIDLVMLYFPLLDPAVSALRPGDSLQLEDPIGVVRTAMQGRTEYLKTFSFGMVTSQCLHAAEEQYQHEEHEVQLWKGIAIVAAAAAVLPLLGPSFGAHAGLAGLAGDVAKSAEPNTGSRILAGAPSLLWKVAQRTLSGEQLSNVLWDEAGHLVIDTVVDGLPRRIAIAGVGRGTLGDVLAERVLNTVREFVRDRAAQMLVQWTNSGHGDVGSVMRPDVGSDLSTELLASGLAALDTSDLATLARQPTLIRAAAYALQGNRGPAVADPGYQNAVQQLSVQVAP